MHLVLRCLERNEGYLTPFGLPRHHSALCGLFREGRPASGDDATDEEVGVFNHVLHRSRRAQGRQQASAFAGVSIRRIQARRNADSAAQPPQRWAICVPEGAHDFELTRAIMLTAMTTLIDAKEPSWALPVLLREGRAAQVRATPESSESSESSEFAEFAARRRASGRPG